MSCVREKKQISDLASQGKERKTHLVVLVLGSNGRKVDNDLDAGLLENLLGSDSTPLEDHGSSESACGKDDHLPRLHVADLTNGGRLLGVERNLGERVVAVLDSSGLGSVERDAEGLLLAKEVEVRLRLDHGVHEAVRGILPATSGGRDPLGPGSDCALKELANAERGRERQDALP